MSSVSTMKHFAPIAFFLISPLVYSQDNSSYLGREIVGSLGAHSSEEVATSHVKDISPVLAAKWEQVPASTSQRTAKIPTAALSIGPVRRDMPMFSRKRQEQAEEITQKPTDFSLIYPPRIR